MGGGVKGIGEPAGLQDRMFTFYLLCVTCRVSVAAEEVDRIKWLDMHVFIILSKLFPWQASDHHMPWQTSGMW